MLILVASKEEWACFVSRTGWILFYLDHFEVSLRFPLHWLVVELLIECELALAQLTPNSMKFVMGFTLLCERLGIPAKAMVFKSMFQFRQSSSDTRWYYISGREKNVVFTNIRNKVSR